jgi:hypothetical protein
LLWHPANFFGVRVSVVPSSDQAIVEVSVGEDSDGAVSGAKSIQIYGSFHNML